MAPLRGDFGHRNLGQGNSKPKASANTAKFRDGIPSCTRSVWTPVRPQALSFRFPLSAFRSSPLPLDYLPYSSSKAPQAIG